LLKENYARSALDGIVKIACKTSNASFEKWFMPILKHQLVCLKLFWDENNVIRPETVINQY
jgi:hypothetical protein